MANVYIYRTNDISRIEIFYGNNKKIHVFINVNKNIQNILDDFIQITNLCSINEFEASNHIPINIIKTFLNICQKGINQTQTTYFNNQINLLDDSEIPNRFIVNPREKKDVLIQTNDQNIDQPNSQTIDQPNDQSNDQKHVQPLVSRNNITNDSIKTLARNVHQIIRNKSIKCPNFTNKSRAGIRKIINFVHNLTRVWISYKQIDLFLTEFNSLTLT